MLKLHTYFRSSASYRCRIALNLKGLAYETAFVHLVKDGGQQLAPTYRALNPQGLLPTLEHEGRVLTQSLAIVEYLEEVWPEPRLLPGDAEMRAKVRAFALAIACDVGPVNNLRVLRYLKHAMGQEQTAIDTWYRHWAESGLEACEALLPSARHRFCFARSRRWPISASFRRCTTRAASRAISPPCRASSPSTPPPARSPPSPRPRPRRSRMRGSWLRLHASTVE